MNSKILTVLTHLELLKKTEEYWNVDWNSGQFLHQLVLAKQPHTILEIGTSTGFSAIWMASALPASGKLITIDVSKSRHAVAKAAFAESGLTNINAILGHAPEVFVDLKNERFDLIFIDCAKNYYLEFFQYLEPQMNPGCVVIADNMVSHGEYMSEYFAYVRGDTARFMSTLVPIGSGMEMTTVI